MTANASENAWWAALSSQSCKLFAIAYSDSRTLARNSSALPAMRQNRLIELIQEHGQVAVAELVALFDKSRDTIRRDLDLLEQRGLLVRRHGGAVHNATLSAWIQRSACEWTNMEGKAIQARCWESPSRGIIEGHVANPARFGMRFAILRRTKGSLNLISVDIASRDRLGRAAGYNRNH